MICISLSPPYATLVAILAKLIETRSWSTSHRGLLAIHQTAAPGPKGTTEAALWDLCLSSPFKEALLAAGMGNPARLPRGKIVAVVDLLHCEHVLYDWPRNQLVSQRSGHRLTDQERAFGDYSIGRYAWLLGNIRALPAPVSARGMPGLWDAPADVEAEIARQMAAPCPHCHAAYDLTHRQSGDRTWCAACNGWFLVQFRPGGAQLLPCEAPVSWPKARRKVRDA